MHILVAEPMDRRSIDWLQQQGATTLHAFEGDDWQAHADKIRAVIYRSWSIDRALMDKLPALEVIGKHGVGVNTVDLDEAASRGIKVTNVAAANANSVAEHGVTLLLAATRSMVVCDAATRGGRYHDRLGMPLVKEIRDTRIGIVGGGNIGRRIGEVMRGGFGCELAYFDPFFDPSGVAHLEALRLSSVDELFTWADNAFIAAPVTSQNRNAIGRDQLRQLGPDGVLVISSRGGIVEEAALVSALKEGLIRAAGIDVFDPEPPADDNPLFELPNVVLTPHFGGHSDRAREAMAARVSEQVWELLNGRDAPLVGGETWMAPKT